MKQSKQTKRNVKGLLVLVILACSAFAANAQCKLVTISSSDTMVISIPNDFPVYDSTGSKQTDDSNYASAFEKWHSSNAASVPILWFGPDQASTYIEIPKSVYDTYSSDRKSAIKAMSRYYRVTQ